MLSTTHSFPCRGITLVGVLSQVIFLHLPHLAASEANQHRPGIDRQYVVSQHDPIRTNTSSLAYDTPAFLGNGRIGFGADITGLQSILPFNTLSSWGWHNGSLPTTPGQTSPADFLGVDWDVHGRLVNYDQPNPDLPDISQWMIANPHRINLGRLGFGLDGKWLDNNVLGDEAHQQLHLWEGVLESTFEIDGEPVSVTTTVHPDSDTIAVSIHSELLRSGRLGVLLDYPYASGKNKFDAPFVGVWNATESHKTTAWVARDGHSAIVQHSLDATTYYNMLRWPQHANVVLTGPDPGTHRYSLAAAGSNTLELTSTFSPTYNHVANMSVGQALDDASKWWQDYWQTGGFLILPSSEQPAQELQRRIILSQYLMAANTANCQYHEQESGLVNNGWYGKFHLEMTVWHNMHYVIWGKPQYISSMMPGTYERFLPTSIERSRQMGYSGARWGKMSDPSGRSAPGEINSLLIWQQPHPMFFADREYRLATNSSQRGQVLEKWAEILFQTAEFMVSFAWWNESTSVYDLGPPMYPSSENTDPSETVNPTFELAYWQYGLQVAADWQTRRRQHIPANWLDVRDKLAPLPTTMANNSKTYAIYEGIQDMWTNDTYVADHPSMTALLGFMPSLAPATQFDVSTLNATLDAIINTWNFTTCFGWDFPMLALAAFKLDRKAQALDFLLHPDFQFDDVGFAVGGSRVPTPYMPSSGALLMAVGSMASELSEDVENENHGTFASLGQDGGWQVRLEGFPSSKGEL